MSDSVFPAASGRRSATWWRASTAGQRRRPAGCAGGNGRPYGVRRRGSSPSSGIGGGATWCTRWGSAAVCSTDRRCGHPGTASPARRRWAPSAVEDDANLEGARSIRYPWRGAGSRPFHRSLGRTAPGWIAPAVELARRLARIPRPAFAQQVGKHPLPGVAARVPARRRVPSGMQIPGPGYRRGEQVLPYGQDPPVRPGFDTLETIGTDELLPGRRRQPPGGGRAGAGSICATPILAVPPFHWQTNSSGTAAPLEVRTASCACGWRHSQRRHHQRHEATADRTDLAACGHQRAEALHRYISAGVRDRFAFLQTQSADVPWRGLASPATRRGTGTPRAARPRAVDQGQDMIRFPVPLAAPQYPVPQRRLRAPPRCPLDELAH